GACSYSSMNLRGTFNSWGSQPMTCDNGVWTTSATFVANGRFKFDAYGDWSTNFGDTNGDGVAEPGGGDVTLGAGNYTIAFDDALLTYSVDITNGDGGDDDSGDDNGNDSSVTVSFSCHNG